MTIVYDLLPVHIAALVAVSVKLYVPGAVGYPKKQPKRWIERHARRNTPDSHGVAVKTRG
jgi:hypothetical protein